MKLLLLVLISSAMAAKEFHTLDVLYSRVPADAQQRTVTALIQRVVGSRASQFKAIVNPALAPNRIDTFHLVNENGTVTIGGSTGVAVAMGLYYYLTNYCNCQITWAGQQLDIPKELPKLPKAGVTVSANDRFRYYQNVCTVSYSFVWYKWEDWEKQLDWMALHGLNLPLAFTGQEAIYQRVYMKMGMTMKDMQTHFGGPAFQAWSRMGNMRGWGGPITQTWLNDQLILQHKILDRMRALGMIPVLPGFAGHVPEALSRIHPKANISQLGDWAGFKSATVAGAQVAIKKSSNFSGRPADWNVQTVCEFIESIPDCAPYVEKFRSEHVNGAALLELDKKDLKEFFEMPLGLAVNVCSHLKKYEEKNK
ncbi:alpha-N-acetylglucosaminidase [Mytilus galloprovincialis]|uniref:Alpha-N-acetylglucosaminidase n=1 Tax=Mytilus galloprovincialis TaxID=29158 RepID=A0A8B6CVJ3_MYTGA|nr:alpha-N-acetylglucosaminidase [Mytilus galloprovincialis]